MRPVTLRSGCRLATPCTLVCLSVVGVVVRSGPRVTCEPRGFWSAAFGWPFYTKVASFV